jgi:hypothetical protein
LLKIIVFIPMSDPEESSSGPPLLPGLLDVASERADDARGQRVVETEGVPDGDRLLPHIEPLVLAHGDRLEEVGWDLDLEHRDVFARLHPDDGCVEGLLVLEGNPEGARPIHHVEVRHDVAILVPDEARATARGHLLRVTEEVHRDPHLRYEDGARRDGTEDRDRIVLVSGPPASCEPADCA